jgi:hypothetical protein
MFWITVINSSRTNIDSPPIILSVKRCVELAPKSPTLAPDQTFARDRQIVHTISFYSVTLAPDQTSARVRQIVHTTSFYSVTVSTGIL